MSIQTPLARVHGLGPAKGGVEHFWRQRVTAVILLPLTIWFVWAVASHVGQSYAGAILFLRNPFNAALMLTFVVTGLYHMMLGIRVVVEDYVHNEFCKLALLVALNFVTLLVGATVVLAVVRIAVIGEFVVDK